MPLPKELQDARRQLDEALHSPKHSVRVKAFSQGLAAFDRHLQEQPDSLHRAVISNVRLAYARALLQSLPRTPDEAGESWVKYLVLMLKLKPEIEAVGQERPALKQRYKDFTQLYAFGLDGQGKLPRRVLRPDLRRHNERPLFL